MSVVPVLTINARCLGPSFGTIKCSRWRYLTPIAVHRGYYRWCSVNNLKVLTQSMKLNSVSLGYLKVNLKRLYSVNRILDQSHNDFQASSLLVHEESKLPHGENSVGTSESCNGSDSSNIWQNEALEGKQTSLLEPCAEPVSEVPIEVPPTFNFAAYMNRSPTLKKLVDLGVDLHKLEKRMGIPQFILSLDFDKDMQEHIRFLHYAGVPSDNLGEFLTRNPLIFKENLDDLQVRINYLHSKKFTKDSICRIITKNPYWLMFSTLRIDGRLGYFQNTFKLTGDEVRLVATSLPRLITSSMRQIRMATFAVEEEMGFSKEEMKALLLKKPRLWMRSNVHIVSRFDFLHNVMKLSHEQMLKQPECLTSRLFRLKQRHLYLKSLSRDQYDTTKESYVSLKALVSGTDSDFCLNVAKTSVEAFNLFQKSL